MAAPVGGTRGLGSGSSAASLAFTLPVSCHVCLNRVQDPVCCSNLHVFCAACIELWLRSSPHCPVCRCPVSAEAPCARIIGGGDVPYPRGSPTQRRRLRSARLEVLRKEYEEEAETLALEVERLQGENATLRTQLRAGAGQPVGSEVDGRPAGGSEVDSTVLLTFSEKLKAARDELRATKREMNGEREERARLREENVDLQRENQSLRMEIESRSPHRFGRTTVAALQAKLEQQRREIGRLGKALERSDRYTDELEARLAGGGAAARPPEGPAEDPPRGGRDDAVELLREAGLGAVRRLAFDDASAPPPEMSEQRGDEGGGGGSGGNIPCSGTPPEPGRSRDPPRDDEGEGISPTGLKRRRAED